MNKKYFSTDMSSAPRCIHDYASPEMQADAAKAAQFYDKKLKELDVKVANPTYEQDPSVVELKRIAPDGNPRTGLRMVKNMISAEVMHIPATQQIHASVDIGGVAKAMHEQPANTTNGNSANASSGGSATSTTPTLLMDTAKNVAAGFANNLLTDDAKKAIAAAQSLTPDTIKKAAVDFTQQTLTDVAKETYDTFVKRVNNLATSFVDIAGISKAKDIFKDVGKADFLGQLETYVNFMRTMTAEWLMLASSKSSNTMDKKLFCCLIGSIKGGPVDVSQLISALAKLRAFLNVASNILNVYNSFLDLINRTIKILVASASAMLSDLLSKFYYMLIIPYVGEAENAIAGKQIVSDGELAQAQKNMDTALQVHDELQNYFDSMNTGDELKDCNFISALLGGIPLSTCDDLLRQIVKLLQIQVGDVFQQTKISQLQTLDDIIDDLIYTLDNITKLGALSANGSFCKDADSGVSAPNIGGTSGNGGNTANLNGSEPGAYSTTPDYGQSPIDGNNSQQPLNITTVPSVNDNIKRILDNAGFFDKHFGYSGRQPADKYASSSSSGSTQASLSGSSTQALSSSGSTQALSNSSNTSAQSSGSNTLVTSNGGITPDDYVASFVENAKDALAKHLAQTLSEQLGVPMSAQSARMFIDARFGDGTMTAASSNSQTSSPMAAYAKDLDEYVDKLS